MKKPLYDFNLYLGTQGEGMHTVICRLSLEHKVFSNTSRVKSNADDRMPSERAYEVNCSQVPALILMSYAL